MEILQHKKEVRNSGSTLESRPSSWLNAGWNKLTRQERSEKVKR